MTTWRVGALLVPLAAVCACSSGSSTSVATSTVTTTVTAPTASPPHVQATPSATTTTTTTTSGTARCDGSSLGVRVDAGNGAAGTIFYAIVFTNEGSAPCYLQGFPGVAATGASGAKPVDAARDTSTKATRVLLAPGAAAHANLAVRNVPQDAEPCPLYPRLLVTPPDSRQTSTIARAVQPCANQMRVTVVQPGATP